MQSTDYQGEKFKEFVKNYRIIDEHTKLFRKIKMEEVAGMLGVSRNQVYKYFSSNSLDDKVVLNIINSFNIDADVIWNDNERFPSRKSEELNEVSLSDMMRDMQDTIKKSLNKNSKPKQEVTPIPYEDYMMVEYVDLSASAGSLGGSNVDLLPQTKKRLVPKEFDNGNYLVIRVNGDSMSDGTASSIPDGAEILVKEHIMHNGDKLPIRGNLFVICSSEGNVFKQIVEHNTEIGYIKCHSYNPNYEDYVIPMSEVFQIFIYKKIVGYRPSIPEIKN